MSEKILALFKILNLKIDWNNSKLKKVGRGRKWKFNLRSIIFCSLLFVLKKFTSSYELINYLNDNRNPEAADFRRLCGFDKLGIPNRRTLERRFSKIQRYLRLVIQKIGKVLVKMRIVKIAGRVVDATTTVADGNVWHKKQKQQGIIPSCGNIDQEAEWGKNSQGWKYGYKAHLFASIKPICVPLDIMVTTANFADDTVYEELTETLIQDNEYTLADSRYDSAKLYEATKTKGCRLIAGVNKRTGKIASKVRQKLVKFLKTNKGKKLYRERSISIEPTNRHFKNLFPGLKRAVVKRLKNISLYWHSSTLIYQLAVIYNFNMKRALKHIKSVIY